MSLWALFAWSALLLVGPWTLMPARGPLPEIHGPIRSLWWLNVMYCAAWHRLESSGMAPLPERGPAILVANHTCGVDPMVLQATCGRLLGFLVAKEIFDIWLIRPFCRLLGCIPVRRDGHDLAATRAALRALKEGRVVPIFPEGRIIPTSGRELGEPKTGVAFIVLHARVPVIPAYISGTPPTNNIWKAVLTPSKARVTYGPPIDFSDVPAGPPYAKATLAEVADRLMAAIRDLQARAWAEPEGARPRPPPWNPLAMLDDLRAVLDRYPAVARPSAPPEPLGNAGGLSGSRLWRYESGRGRLVARAWPVDGRPRMAIEQIHRWLGEASGLGFVPIPLAALDGRTLHERGGRLWEVDPWLAGTAAPGPPPPSRLRAGFAALAAFHQRLCSDRTRGPSPGLQDRLHEVEILLGGGLTALDRVLGQASADPLAAPAKRWLALARWTAPRLVESLRRASGRVVALQPCLRDARPEHLLFEGDRVTGLVDFGAMAVESVAADLARLLAEWIGPDRTARAEALDAYAAIRPLDESEIVLIDAFEASAALLGAGHWVRWHFVEGRPFDAPGAVERRIEHGLERLARLAVGLA